MCVSVSLHHNQPQEPREHGGHSQGPSTGANRLRGAGGRRGPVPGAGRHTGGEEEEEGGGGDEGRPRGAVAGRA